MEKAVRWACGLGVCLWLCSLGSLSAQADPSSSHLAAPFAPAGQSPKELHSSPSGQEPAPQPTNLPSPGSRLTPAPDQNQWAPPKTELSPFPDFPLLKELDPPPPSLADLGIHWDRLALLPDPELAEEMDVEFSRRLARLNRQIANQQERLYRLLQTWDSDEADIRQIQAQLSQLRTERDRLALEHLLMLRQLQENFALPLPDRSAASSP
ncbi:hypothetical protein NW832_01010 [Synechococcus sp. R5-16]|uniref:hypothetical protein n=1 Tax=unclassified Synechococcus TaxID=2626047 RepID=UPI0039C15FA0